MKTGLQKAALARLARLTQHHQLPVETQTQLRERLLKRCAEPKKALPNGVNGVNRLGSSSRMIVYSPISKFRKFGANFGPGHDRVQFLIGFDRDVH